MHQSLRSFFTPLKPIETKEKKMVSYSIISIALNLIDSLDDYETHFFNHKHFPTEIERATIVKLTKFTESFCSTISKVERVRKSAYCFTLSNKILDYLNSLDLNELQKMALMVSAISEIYDETQKVSNKKLKNIKSHCSTLFISQMAERGHTFPVSIKMELVNKTKSATKVNYNKYSTELP